MFFDRIEAAPADPILGLTEAFKKDPNPNKINLGVGIYKDENGKTPVLDVVKAAEKKILETETTKAYLPITGLPEFADITQKMVFGSDSEIVTSGRAVTCHCPGGTGALRIGADFIKQQNVAATVWISDPTWANHFQIVSNAGLKYERYPYYDRATHSLAFDKMMETLMQAKEGDVVLLHACCHNPTGIDPTKQQWEQIASLLAEKKLLPLIDFAYQGFGYGLEEDAAGVRIIASHCPELMITSSYSKNLGLYNERVGALTVVCDNKASAEKVISQVKVSVRSSISNPPAHGEKIVVEVLGNPDSRKKWEVELASMRNRIRSMRELLSRKLSEYGAGDFSFITGQNGMFSFSGLTKEDVEFLKSRHGIYIVDSGRICIAAVTENNVDALAKAVAEAVKESRKA